MTIALNWRQSRRIDPEYLDYWPQTHVWWHEGDRLWVLSCHTALGYQINGDHEEVYEVKEDALDAAQAYMDSDRTGDVWEYSKSRRLIRLWTKKDEHGDLCYDSRCITGKALTSFQRQLGIYGQ